MSKFTKIVIYIVAALVAAGVAYMPSVTGPVTYMRHLPMPKAHTNPHRVTMQASLSLPPTSAPKVITLPTVTIKARPAPTSKHSVVKAPTRTGQVCELHTLEQGGSQVAPFVLYCHN